MTYTEPTEHSIPPDKKPSICLVSTNVYHVFCPTATTAFIGGAEVQQMILASALRDAGHHVSVATGDFGQQGDIEADEIMLYRSFKPNSGLPIIRFIHPKLTKLYRALARANADVYYVFGAGFLVGITAAFARLKNRKFVFGIASDDNIKPDLMNLPNKRDRWLYENGLRLSDQIIAQTDAQAELLYEHYNLPSVLIRSTWPRVPKPIPRDARRYIIWSSMFRPGKQPEVFVRLAKAFPNEQFLMIGAPNAGCENMFDRTREASRDVPNLRLLGFKTLLETEEYFDLAKLLVNTSIYEGFPNTFLQAWSRGVPVLSFVDPDSAMSKCGLGLAVETEDNLIAGCRRLAVDYDFDPETILNYFQQYHGLRTVAAQYSALFHELVTDRAARLAR